MLLCEANNMSTIWTKMKHTVCEKSNETNWGLLICLNLIANTLLLRVWCAVCLGALAAWGLCNTACWVADFFFFPALYLCPLRPTRTHHIASDGAALIQSSTVLNLTTRKEIWKKKQMRTTPALKSESLLIDYLCKIKWILLMSFKLNTAALVLRFNCSI